MPRLVVKSGPLAGQTFELEADQVIGRVETDIAIDDAKVSRRHAVVRPAAGGIEVEDLSSLNGTFVDDVRVKRPVTVGHGGLIKIGRTVFTVDVSAAADATVASSGHRAPTELDVPAPAAPPAPVSAHAAPPAGAFTAPAARRRRAVASRRWVPTVASFGTIVLTASALLVYFGSR